MRHSAGSMRRSDEDLSVDAEEEDEFGYTECEWNDFLTNYYLLFSFGIRFDRYYFERRASWRVWILSKITRANWFIDSVVNLEHVNNNY